MGGGTLSSADKVVNKTSIVASWLAMMGVVQVGVMMQRRGK
jgi:hypothetical protein